MLNLVKAVLLIMFATIIQLLVFRAVLLVAECHVWMLHDDRVKYWSVISSILLAINARDVVGIAWDSLDDDRPYTDLLR